MQGGPDHQRQALLIHLQVSFRIAASSDRQPSTLQEEKLGIRGLGTSRQFKRPKSDELVPGAPSKLSRPSAPGSNPGTVEELEEVIANNCPIFYFHPAEKYAKPAFALQASTPHMMWLCSL